MINHSGQFERVGGPGFFFPSLAEAAQAVEVDASRLPNARSGSHYIPASVQGGGRNDAGRVSFHSDGRGGRVFNFKTSMMAVWREAPGSAFRLLSVVGSSTNERLPRRLKLRPRRRGPLKAITRRN